MSGVQEIASIGELEATISGRESTVILYTKSWCPHCERFKPTFKGAAQTAEFASILFRSITLDRYAETDEQWHKPAPGVPQVHFYQDGQRMRIETGYLEQNIFYECLRATYFGTGDPSTQPKDNGAGSEPACTINRTMESRPMCEGKFEDRRKRTLLFNKQKKTFTDLEPNCVFRPTDDERGILIGRANDDASYFDIILWNAPHEDPGRVYFSLDFMPDPVKRARFESVLFSVTFGQDSSDGKHIPLAIKDLFPTDAEDAAARRLLALPAEGISSEPTPLDDDASFVSSLDDSASRVPVTTSVIRGQGLHSATAVWNITEDETSTSRPGLDAQYNMYITLPTSSKVWMKFWAKAVLVSGDQVGLGLKHRSTLRIGMAEKPYERILDLSEVLRQT